MAARLSAMCCGLIVRGLLGRPTAHSQERMTCAGVAGAWALAMARTTGSVSVLFDGKAAG